MKKSRADTPAIEGGTPVRAAMLPFYRAAIDERDIESVVDTLRSGWLTVGPRTERLERVVAEYLGVDHVVAVSSCSEAMFLALVALGVGPGDEVITSSLTFASTVHAIIHVGATPVLADIEPETLGLDPAAVAARVGPRTRALLPVHFGGQACRIMDICEIAARRNLAVVEDAAHSFGATVEGRPLGAFGDATAFSFYATKNITTGEGGAVSTGDGELAARLRLWSYHGMSRDSWNRYADRGSWYYQVEVPGYKCNMSDVLAALGLSQMEKIDRLLSRRRAIAARYDELLSGSEFFELPRERRGNGHTWHLFAVQLRLDALTIDRNRFIEALTAENIGSSVHFIPIYRHPFFAPYGAEAGEFPACESYYSRCVSLPLFPDMSVSDADDVVEALNRIASYYRSGS
jgi:dTDP-4-amino-4,6-dideoxygalactose transaminase